MAADMHESPRILHVDDDEDIRTLVRMALVDIGGLEVTQYSSGAETIMNASRTNADLFLLDVMMPDMSGPETLKKLRAIPEFTSTPAVFLTAAAVNQELKAIEKNGDASVITKPFDPMTLAETLTQIWRSSLR